MKWNDREGWKLFIYKLLYPGIVGSMIFDMLDPLRPIPDMVIDPHIIWGTRVIAAAFVADFFHMVVDLKAETSKRTFPCLDAAIAITFCLAYFWLTKLTAPPDKAGPRPSFTCGSSLMFLGMAFFLIYKYERLWKKRFDCHDLVRLISLVICGAGLVTVLLSSAFSANPWSVRPTFIAIALSSFIYTIYVLRLGHKGYLASKLRGENQECTRLL